MKKLWPLLIVTLGWLVICQKPEETGWIAVNSTPEGAAVYLDDSLTDETTNCVLEDVPVGEHHLKLTLDDYFDWEDSVVVEADDTLKLEVELTNQVGYLKMKSEPQGAEVYVGINSTGKQTNCILEVPTGDRTVKLLLDDYKEWTRDVTVEAEDTVYLNAYLIPDSVQPGDVLWWYESGEMAISSLALGIDGTVYFIAGTSLYAISPEGGLLWSVDIELEEPTGGNTIAVGPEGHIYFKTWGYLYALNEAGSVIWQYSKSGITPTPPTIGSDGSVYLAANGLRALSPQGGLLWETIYGGSCSQVIAADDAIYTLHVIRDGVNNLGSISFEGELQWHSPIWALLPDFSYLATGEEGIVYFFINHYEEVGSDDIVYDFTRLYSYNSKGSQKWYVDFGGTVIHSPAIGVNGELYFGMANQFHSYDSYGKMKWIYNTAVCGTPAIGTYGNIYFGSTDGYFYAINSGGNLVWNSYIGSTGFCSPAISDDGVIYVGANDGCLYAIYSESGGLANSPWPKYRADNQNTGRARY